MIVGTYRDTDVDRGHPLAALLADVRKMDGVSRIAVDGLGPEGVRELLVRGGGHELDDAGLQFAERVQTRYVGQPVLRRRAAARSHRERHAHRAWRPVDE